jgi:hypothetical protein
MGDLESKGADKVTALIDAQKRASADGIAQKKFDCKNW